MDALLLAASNFLKIMCVCVCVCVVLCVCVCVCCSEGKSVCVSVHTHAHAFQLMINPTNIKLPEAIYNERWSWPLLPVTLLGQLGYVVFVAL
jgi:hypothetical protein